MDKDFDGWNMQKKNIDKSQHKPPLFNEREIWWCTYGLNIGTEVYGKNKFFRRPVMIFKKLAKTSFIGLPLSTKEKIGTWYINVTHSKGIKNCINLSQIRHMDYRRLDKKIGILDASDFNLVKKSMSRLLGIIN
jgi:mRNA-degrading endonuclease toxin of MazEF toxin-antitoxin module